MLLMYLSTKDRVEGGNLHQKFRIGYDGKREYDRYILRSEPVIHLDLECTDGLARECNRPTSRRLELEPARQCAKVFIDISTHLQGNTQSRIVLRPGKQSSLVLIPGQAVRADPVGPGKLF